MYSFIQALCQMSPSSPPHLLSGHLGHHVPGVDVDGADGHDLLSIARCELPNQHGDEAVELGHLLPVVLFHGVVITLLQTDKRHAHVRRPPDRSECRSKRPESEVREEMIGGKVQLMVFMKKDFLYLTFLCIQQMCELSQ